MLLPKTASLFQIKIFKLSDIFDEMTLPADAYSYLVGYKLEIREDFLSEMFSTPQRKMAEWRKSTFAFRIVKTFTDVPRFVLCEFPSLRWPPSYKAFGNLIADFMVLD